MIKRLVPKPFGCLCAPSAHPQRFRPQGCQVLSHLEVILRDSRRDQLVSFTGTPLRERAECARSPGRFSKVVCSWVLLLLRLEGRAPVIGC